VQAAFGNPGGVEDVTKDGIVDVDDLNAVTACVDNSPPACSAVDPVSATISAGDTQTVTMTADDPDVGDTLTYRWTVDGVSDPGISSSAYPFITILRSIIIDCSR